jgi:hypothetical protein
MVETFFFNPAMINHGLGADDIFTFTGPNIVVRYTPQDILEYARYTVIDRSAAPNLITDFTAAYAFINADLHLMNEWYLDGYEAADGQHTFRFGYIVGGLPLPPSAGWPGLPELRHPVEITVDHGTVVRYRKLVYHFTFLDS